jgi:hypothetical protein
MKKTLTITILFLGYGMFSQDISKMLQNGKWYSAKDKSGKIIYSKNANSEETPSYEFRQDGKVIHCGMTIESSLDAKGNELTAAPSMRCDSVWHYELKNGMLKMQLLKQPADHYKLAMKGETWELTPIKSEEYK